MPNEIFQDPLEGKGEEMIPQRGLPFDDIDKTPLEEIPPEERIPDYSEAASSPPVEEIAPEDIPVEKLHPFDNSAEPSFQLSTKESEALLGTIEESFNMEATPWNLTQEEAEAFMGSADEAFTPKAEEETVEDRSLHGPPGEMALVENFAAPQEAEPDMGLSTHLEDDPVEIQKLFLQMASQPMDPFSPPGGAHPQTPTIEQPADNSTIDLLISDEDMLSLWHRADQAQKEITRHIATLYIAQPLLNHIQSARNELMSGKERYEDAERHVNEVEYHVQLSIHLDKWSKTIIPRLYTYLASWFIVSFGLLFLLGENIFSSDGPTLLDLAGSMIWGGVGGIVGALMPLIKHFSVDQDFAPRHSWWYITSPFVGSVMGAIIYLFMMLGSLSISSGDISSPVIIYILAGLAGYQHKVFTNLVKRMLKVLEIEEKEDSTQPETE